MYFRLLPKVGGHAFVDPSGKTVFLKASEGVVIESEVDLFKLFPNKFERVEAPAGPASAPVGPSPVSPLGRDVTQRFPLAVEHGFKVFADGGAFVVVEADDPGVVLHEKPLKRKDVGSFITGYIGS